MRDDKLEIDSAAVFVAFCKSVNSPIKMNKRCAEVILANLESRDITLCSDEERNLYQTDTPGQEVSTTLDDVIDEVCEWNYEDIESAKQALKRADDYIAKCRLNSQIEKLEKEARALNYIFYQTKYGRNIEKLADRIAKDVMEQLNLVPVYDVPFYEDRVTAVQAESTVRKPDKDEARVSAANGVLSEASAGTPVSDKEGIPDETDKVDIVVFEPYKVEVGEREKAIEESKGAR